jgi:hypothetical protein
MPSFSNHTCGYPIISVIPHAVQRLKLVVWYDGGKDSPTFQEEIRRCPGCGQELTLASLLGRDVEVADNLKSAQT